MQEDPIGFATRPPLPPAGATTWESVLSCSHPLGGLTSAGTPLDRMPLPSALAGLPLFSVANSNASTASSSSSATTALSSAIASVVPAPPTPKQLGAGAVVLSSALPPIGAKLVQKIRSDQYVAMKELMADNMALHSQLEDLPVQATGSSRLHRLREVDSPLTWAFCFLAYVAVRTTDDATRDLLSYARLIIREAQCHGGSGWLEYDKWFRQQQAALSTRHPWNELNASLHAATVMSLRTGETKLCKLCKEPDHSETQCALASLYPPQQIGNPAMPSGGPAAGKRTRPEMLERICTSWNKGRCVYPGSCRFRHICITCRRKGHRARDCEETPADSPFRTAAPPSKTNSDSSQR